MHLGCPRREIDAWLDSWLGFGKILVQNRKRVRTSLIAGATPFKILAAMGILSETCRVCLGGH